MAGARVPPLSEGTGTAGGTGWVVTHSGLGQALWDRQEMFSQGTTRSRGPVPVLLLGGSGHPTPASHTASLAGLTPQTPFLSVLEGTGAVVSGTFHARLFPGKVASKALGVMLSHPLTWPARDLAIREAQGFLEQHRGWVWGQGPCPQVWPCSFCCCSQGSWGGVVLSPGVRGIPKYRTREGCAVLSPPRCWLPCGHSPVAARGPRKGPLQSTMSSYGKGPRKMH